MKTFQCTGCGHQLQRPTQPFKCPQCGRQAVGLFRVVQGTPRPAQPQGGPPGAYPAQGPSQPQYPQQPSQPQTYPQQPSPPAGYPQQPQGYPQQPSQPPAGRPPQSVGPPGQHGGIAPLAPPPPPPGAQPPRPAGPAPAAPQAPQYPPAAPQAPRYPPQQTPPAGAPPAQGPVQPQPVYPPPGQPAPSQPVPPQPPPGQPPVQGPAQPTRQPPASRPSPPPPQKQRPTPPPLPGSGRKTKGEQAARSSQRASRKASAGEASGPAPASRPAAAPAAPPQPKPEPPPPPPRVRPKPVRPEQFVWAYPAEPPYEDEARAMRNAPAVDPSGRVILYTQRRLLALAEEEGKPKVVWEYVIGSPVPGPVVVSADGTIRAHCADGYLHCLNASGKQEWSPARVGEPLGYAAPLVDDEGNTYISAYDGGLVRVDAEGRVDQRPYFRSRRKLDSAGILHGGVLYVGSEDGYVFAIELGPKRGRNLWDHAAERGHTGWFLNSSPAVSADGLVVVAARDENLYGFDPEGRPAWCTRMPGQMLGSPVIDRQGHLYVGAFQAHRGEQGRGYLVCLDGNSHKVRWRYEAAGPVESTPVIGDDDLVYFGDNSGTIHAVEPDGKARWTAKVECAVRSAGTILAPGRLAFGLDDDTLVVVKCSSGGLSPEGWPKVRRDLGQSGIA